MEFLPLGGLMFSEDLEVLLMVLAVLVVLGDLVAFLLMAQCYSGFHHSR